MESTPLPPQKNLINGPPSSHTSICSTTMSPSPIIHQSKVKGCISAPRAQGPIPTTMGTCSPLYSGQPDLSRHLDFFPLKASFMSLHNACEYSPTQTWPSALGSSFFLWTCRHFFWGREAERPTLPPTRTSQGLSGEESVLGMETCPQDRCFSVMAQSRFQWNQGRASTD